MGGRYFNVIGSDSKGRLGEAPRPELRAHGRISGACFDAAMGQIAGLKVLYAVCALQADPLKFISYPAGADDFNGE